MKHLDKVFVIIAIIIVGIVLVYGPWEKSVIGIIFEPFIEPDWEKIIEHDLVKSSVIISMTEKNGSTCLVEAAKIHDIINHSYFVKSNEFGEKINYNNSTNVITIPCNELQGDESRLHVWYVVKEAPEHAEKYKYFITAPEETGIEKGEYSQLEN